MLLENKVAIITGAASGMGLDDAKMFAREGATVVLLDVLADEVQAVADEINGDGGEAFAIETDLRNKVSIEAAVAQTIEKYGKIDILINNAGVFDKYATVLDTSDELWDLVMGVDLKGMFHLCQAVLPHMLEAGSGSIVNIASIAGLVAGKGGAAYMAAKHAAIGLTKNICYTYAKDGIRCNAICPGTIVTPLIKDLVANIPRDNVPARRFGDPAEVADLAIFLASDKAGFLNGQAIAIDGGYTIA